jgi:hypothetical protein
MDDNDFQKILAQQVQLSRKIKRLSNPIKNNPALRTMTKLNRIQGLLEPYQRLANASNFASISSIYPLNKNILNVVKQLKPLQEQIDLITRGDAFKVMRKALEIQKKTLEESGIQDLLRKAKGNFPHIDYNAISAMKNSPFLMDSATVLSYAEEFGEPLGESYLYDINKENLHKEISQTKDFNDLPKQVRWIILNLLISIISAYLYDQIKPLIYNQVEISAPDITTSRQAKSFARNPRVNYPSKSLIDIRITTGHGVNLREKPCMKGSIIRELPIGKLIDVLDRSNRTWLLVGLEIDGEYQEGWVSRRYTATFK